MYFREGTLILTYKKLYPFSMHKQTSVPSFIILRKNRVNTLCKVISGCSAFPQKTLNDSLKPIAQYLNKQSNCGIKLEDLRTLNFFAK